MEALRPALVHIAAIGQTFLQAERASGGTQYNAMNPNQQKKEVPYRALHISLPQYQVFVMFEMLIVHHPGALGGAQDVGDSVDPKNTPCAVSSNSPSGANDMNLTFDGVYG